MKNIRALAFVIFALVSWAFAQTVSVTPDELKTLEGAEWVGELTYLDYSSNEKTSIKSNLKISKSNDPRVWTFDYIYPREPKANGTSMVGLSADGRTFNDQAVVEKSKLADGTLKFVSTKPGTDNERKALFRFTYLFSATKFSIKKEVKVDGTDTYFERNTYTWSR